MRCARLSSRRSSSSDRLGCRCASFSCSCTGQRGASGCDSACQLFSDACIKRVAARYGTAQGAHDVVAGGAAPLYLSQRRNCSGIHGIGVCNRGAWTAVATGCSAPNRTLQRQHLSRRRGSHLSSLCISSGTARCFPLRRQRSAKCLPVAHQGCIGARRVRSSCTSSTGVGQRLSKQGGGGCLLVRAALGSAALCSRLYWSSARCVVKARW